MISRLFPAPLMRFGLAAAFLSIWPVLLPVGAAAPAARPAPRYALTDLGELPNVADDVALKINERGQVAGWTDIGGDTLRAVLWTDGKPRNLGVPTGFGSSLARGLNNKGAAVGWAVSGRVLVDTLATTHACLFSNGRVQDLGTLGGRDSRAFAINDAGQVAGVSGRADGKRHAFLWTKGQMKDLGTLPGGTFSEAYAVNSKGEVAGNAESASHALHGFLWRQGRMIDLGALPAGKVSLAYGVNEGGAVVGSAEESEEFHAVLHTGGKLRDLGTLGSDPAAAFSVNSRGQVVGASNLSMVVRHAFLWENGQMHDLNTMIPAGSNWTLLSATGINRAGRIVCVVRGKSGSIHGVLLTPIVSELFRK